MYLISLGAARHSSVLSSPWLGLKGAANSRSHGSYEARASRTKRVFAQRLKGPQLGLVYCAPLLAQCNNFLLQSGIIAAWSACDLIFIQSSHSSPNF